MNFNEYINKDEYEEIRNFHNNYMKNLYNSPRGYFLKIHMDLDDFKNEVYIRLIKYWNFENFNGSLKQYLIVVTKNTMKSLYEKMDSIKNSINYDLSVERFDKEVGENEQEIVVIHKDEIFNEISCINYILKFIEIDIDKKIVEMFLNGIEKTKIAKTLNVSRAFVRHRLENKYNTLMKEKFTEYVNAI